jgi:mannose-6-phosphate isomerase-like protein (cupin superfamily)
MTLGAGDGYAVSSLDEIGEGYGFRKIRPAVGVTAFGINALVLPPGYATGLHYHDEQEETYFVHAGEVEIRFGPDGDQEAFTMGPGGVARVSPTTIRGLRNLGPGDAIVVVVGGRDGYVGRDGRTGEGETSARPPGAA